MTDEGTAAAFSSPGAPAYRRVLLKLSGEVFGGGSVGVDPDVAQSLAQQITMGQVAEPYIPRRAERHLEKGRVVIFGAGAGLPYFTTDTVAAQRALEMGCQVLLLGKSGVDGVYDADPRLRPDAVKFDTISYDEVLQRGLEVADAAAFSLCRDNGMPIVVFELTDGNIARAARGEKIGTLVNK